MRQILIFAYAIVAMACGSDAIFRQSGAAGLFKATNCGQVFYIAIDDPDMALIAEAQINTSNPLVLNGPVISGDGEFNHPWSWHLDPTDISFDEVTIELCDGCPQAIEDDVTTWIATVERFCPWSGRILERVG